jgi:hypothetical protein
MTIKKRETNVHQLDEEKILAMYTLPGNKFFGRQNSMEYGPTTILDDICQYPDLFYAHRPNSLKRKITKNLI